MHRNGAHIRGRRSCYRTLGPFGIAITGLPGAKSFVRFICEYAPRLHGFRLLVSVVILCKYIAYSNIINTSYLPRQDIHQNLAIAMLKGESYLLGCNQYFVKANVNFYLQFTRRRACTHHQNLLHLAKTRTTFQKNCNELLLYSL